MMRYFLLLPFFLVACNEEPPPPQKKPLTPDQVKQLSDEMGKWDTKRQHDEIDQYVKAHNYTMQETASGLRYMWMKEGSGQQAEHGMTAKVDYKIYLLDGTVCYTSEKEGPKEVLIGKDYVEAGLHEGLQLMKVGDKMLFILPSHLAHGLTGDQSKIPARSSVVYEVELLELKDETDKVVK